MNSGHGAILVNTRSGPRKNDASLTGLKSFYPKGFHVSQPFKMPDYNNQEIRNSKVPDLRTTIYWNGDLITDKDGKLSINFFTADEPTTYIITVSGVTVKGDRIYKTSTLSRR